jgi:leucyl aminopeptidase
MICYQLRRAPLKENLAMHFTFPTDDQDLTALRADLCAVLVFDGECLDSPQLRALDQAFSGLLSKLLEEEQFSGKKTQCLNIHTHGKLGASRVLLVGLGKRKDFQPSDVRFAAARAIRTANGSRGRSIAIVLPDGIMDAAPRAGRIAQFLAEGAILGAYQFDRYRTGDRKRPSTVAEVAILSWLPGEKVPAEGGVNRALSVEVKAACERGATRGACVSRGVMMARDLVNEGASEMTPRRLATIAEQLGRDQGFEVEILGPKECSDLGMGLFLAVARGSTEEPRFLHLTYRPKGRAPRRRIVLIGKSVTFDSGGLSIKTMEGMMDMKMDMGGGATVLGAASVLGRLDCPDEVHIICAATENMPSGSAYKLGDVLRSMNGKTVEITNTDAEGRLTLADAVTYALSKIKPDEIIDFATLTGACTVALGPNIAGVMSNDQQMADRVLGASRDAGEDMWQLPLPDRLMDMLKSEIADLKNCGERMGGCLTAGLFVKEFVGETPWVHVDMAGPVQATKEWGHQAKGATGFGVSTILELLVPR